MNDLSTVTPPMGVVRKAAPKAEARRLAQERIDMLWEASLAAATTKPVRARRWMCIAKAVARRTRIKIPRYMMKRICKGCGAVLVPGQNCRVRLRHNRSTHLSVTCLECGTVKRFSVRQQV